MSLVPYANESDDDSSSTPAPAPVPAKKVKRFVIEAEEKGSGTAGDDGDAEPKKRLKLDAATRPTASNGGSGLFSLLPPPKVANGVIPKKNAGGGDLSSSAATTLMPNSVRLANKSKVVPAPHAAPAAPAPAPTKPSVSLVGYGDDSEEEDGEKEEEEEEAESTSSVPFFSLPTPSAPTTALAPQGTEYGPARPVATNMDYSIGDSYAPAAMPAPSPYAVDYSGGNYSYGYYEGSSSSSSSSRANHDSEQVEEDYEEEEDEDEIHKSEADRKKSELMSIVNDRKLRNVPVQFVDINQDDQIDITKVQVPEVFESEFKGDTQYRDKPTSKWAKTRHHISYLAHFAIEKERDIQERRAQGIKSRKETQGKYGF